MNEQRPDSSVLRFCKLEGAGNDFILLNAALLRGSPDPGELARRLCKRRTSVGADGLITVEAVSACGADVRARFWNPDGEEVATCGNGTRCAARFAVLENMAPPEMVIDTASGHIAGRVSGLTVTLRYSAEPTVELSATVTTPGGSRSGHRVEIGNPHFIIQLEQLPDGPIEAECRPLRYA
ncbi:MAG TPA: hypothetical protein VLC48_06185, partial [Gemmatimonadota bacterium]|nr:hypothetical protein [Gemmatimonadota bacterium]